MPNRLWFWKGLPLFAAVVVFAASDISPKEALNYVGDPTVQFLDVREASEYESGHIPGALLMPWTSGVLALEWESLPRDKTIIVYCRSGGRSAQAFAFLQEKGFSLLLNMTGGFSSYQTVPGAIVETGPYQEPVTAVADWALY
ncbi:MAG: rhodanese-like domain-containing protein [Candidatus Omnitrophota bacterium]